MKRLLIMICFVMFTVVCCCGFFNIMYDKYEQSNAHKLSHSTVVIDAGHGGKDVGALGVDGSHESDINLAIAFDLYDYLMVSGVNSILTRDGDYQTYYDNADRNKSDLYCRLDLVNKTENSVLVSIHQNHFDNEKERGTQVWYAPNSPQSKLMADSVLLTVNSFLMPDNARQNKESGKDYYILYKASQPSIMVECGFISNTDENAKLQDDKYQNDMAFSIFAGLCGEI